ncbi:MAG: type II toxin-antitoxin system RelE/ParE family toxin [Nitrospinae bacterium]|nr:type II toxin-antitoxin system RelE/ParE family toxin [Nitrospinota bacterium]
MPKYISRTMPTFKKDCKALKKRHDLFERLTSKIEEILEDPSHYKNLRNVLKNRQRVHIGSYVLVFEVDEEKKRVVLHNFKHHDQIYKQP